MAAGTPTLEFPGGGETGIRLDERMLVKKTIYSGDASQAEWQIQVATDSGFAAADIIYDTGLHGTVRWIVDDDWWELWPARMNDDEGLQPGTIYYMRCRVRNNEGTPVTSSWSSTASFTMETPDLTAAEWAEAQ